MRLICLDCDFEAYCREDIPELEESLRKSARRHEHETGHIVLGIPYPEKYKKMKEFFRLLKLKDKTERAHEMVKWLNKGLFSRAEIVLDYIDHLESLLKQR